MHSTATPGVMAKSFRDRWNNTTVAKAVHAFLDDREVIECLPDLRQAWHVATTTGNNYYFGFEICEDRDHTEEYFIKAYKNAVEYTSIMLGRLGLSVNDVFSHKEGNRKGIASNHGDPEHWFSKFGYNMDDFRRAIYKELNIVVGLRSGDTGHDVKLMQSILETLGYNISVDGFFGPASDVVVRQFQKENSLLDDGSFGPMTEAKALELIDILRAPKALQTLAPDGYLYRVQTGAFGVKENAHKLADEISSKGYKTYIKLEKI